MNEMVERVARAIFEVAREEYHDEQWEQPSTTVMRETYRKLANAAITAMHDPTDAMRVAGGKRCCGNDWFSPEDFPAEAADIWREMINAALK